MCAAGSDHDHAKRDPVGSSTAEDGSSVDTAIRLLIEGGALAGDLVRRAARAHPDRIEIHAALALIAADPAAELTLAQRLATTRRHRQHVAIVAEHLVGDVERARLLARQHLAEFPDDALISWLSSQG